MKRKQNIRAKIALNIKDVKKKEIKLLTSGIRIVVEKNEHPAVCPYCKTVSDKVYEYRKQIILDKPKDDKKVEIEVNKRRFVCVNQSCPAKTFTETIEGLSVTRRYTKSFENFLKELIKKDGYLTTQRVLVEKYGLRLSLATLFYMDYQNSK